MGEIQIKKGVFVEEERLAFYKENNFTGLFDLAENIIESIGHVDEWTAAYIEKQTLKTKVLQTETEKQAWYSETLRGLTQINQALFSVMVLLNSKTKEE